MKPKNLTYDALAQRRSTLVDSPYLFGEVPFRDPDSLEGNIENFIGMAAIPTGIIGPVKVNGTQAEGEFSVPLSTTEGALVASYNRGARACREAGGATSICVAEGVQRCPVFKFNNLGDLSIFTAWIKTQTEHFKGITSKVSRFAKLVEVRANIGGTILPWPLNIPPVMPQAKIW